MNRSYKNYIPKILQQISDFSITKQCKIQIDYILLFVSKLILSKCITLLEMTDKTTLSIKTLTNGIQLVFRDDMLINMMTIGEEAIGYKNKDYKQKFVIPQTMGRNIMIKYLPSYIRLGNKTSFLFTSIIEYLAYEILDLTWIQTYKHKRVRLNPRDLFMAINQDRELFHFCKEYDIILMNGFSNRLIDAPKPFMGPSYFQTMIPKHSFSNCVREIASIIEGDNVKVNKDVIPFLQQYIEQDVVDILIQGKKICEYSGRTKVNAEDIRFCLQNS